MNVSQQEPEVEEYVGNMTITVSTSQVRQVRTRLHTNTVSGICVFVSMGDSFVFNEESDASARLHRLSVTFR